MWRRGAVRGERVSEPETEIALGNQNQQGSRSGERAVSWDWEGPSALKRIK